MEIFGKHIFGSDAENWLKQCKEFKKEWILKYTNQTNETLIDEFINNPKISKECKCLDCGKRSISKRVPKEIATITEPSDTIGNGAENSNVGRKSTKRKKAK